MKRKDNQKTSDPKKIDPAVLDKILGGVQTAEGQGGAVIPQTPITSFYHS